MNKIWNVFGKQIIKQMRATTKKSDMDELERGFFLCKRKGRLVKGRTIIGNKYQILDHLWEAKDVQCPSGTLEYGTFHTHAHTEPYPSQEDIDASIFEDHIISCIGGLNKIKCWDLREDSHRLLAKF